MSVSFSRLVAGLAALFMSAGCTFYPYDHQVIAHTTSPVLFEGCSSSPNSPIAISAGNRASVYTIGGLISRWDVVANLSSPSAPTVVDVRGNNWYCWSTSLVLAPQYWATAVFASLPEAFVKVFDNGQLTWTYGNDPQQCTRSVGADQFTNAAPCALAPNNSGSHAISPGAIAIDVSAW